MEKHKITYSKKEIWFHLEYKNVKNLNLSIKPDQSVFVSVPINTPYEKVEVFVKSKANWIITKTSKFELTKPLHNGEKEYVSGETFKYLGKQYRLKIEEVTSKEFVTIKSSYITIFVKKKDNIRRKQNLLNDWFRKRAHSVFQEAMDEMYPLVQGDLDTKPAIEIKTMTKRWGSCLRSKNTVLLNFELIKAPRDCINYVVLHELIHFIHKNHDSKFYNHLTVLMPNWKERKAILDEEVVMFI
jgi:predicted metal-dependent hydrolase